MEEDKIRGQLQILRKRSGLSIRQLAAKAGVTAGMISCIERGKNSPSIGMMQKLITALGSDLASFFSGEQDQNGGPVFLREKMQMTSDAERTYTIVFPKRADIKVEMLDEQINPSRKKKPAFEELRCDVAGHVISGSLILEIKGEPKKELRSGDAFYVPRGQIHRGYVVGEESARLITVYYPNRY